MLYFYIEDKACEIIDYMVLINILYKFLEKLPIYMYKRLFP